MINNPAQVCVSFPCWFQNILYSFFLQSIWFSIHHLSFPSTWNLFIHKVLNILLIKGSFSLVVLNLSFVSYFNFVMFNLTLARSTWWSYPKLAQDFQLSVSIEKWWWYGQTNFGPFFAWDSNFLVDIFMRKDFLSPFAFISPHPCFPIVYFHCSFQLWHWCRHYWVEDH